MPGTGVAHVCLKTSDLQRTLDFYCDAVGTTRLFNFVRDGKTVGCYLQASAHSFIEVFETSAIEPGANSRAALNHFCLETPEIHALHRRLIEKGYAPREISLGADKTWQFWITDPNGLEIEFQQYTSESSQMTGADVQLA